MIEYLWKCYGGAWRRKMYWLLIFELSKTCPRVKTSVRTFGGNVDNLDIDMSFIKDLSPFLFTIFMKELTERIKDELS